MYSVESHQDKKETGASNISSRKRRESSPVKQNNIFSLLRLLVELEVGVVDERLPEELLSGLVELQEELGLSAFQSYPQ